MHQRRPATAGHRRVIHDPTGIHVPAPCYYNDGLANKMADRPLDRSVDGFQYRFNAGPGKGFAGVVQVVEDSEDKRLTWGCLMERRPGPRWMPK